VGRLFWKFFVVLLLAQIVAVLGVGLMIGLHNREFLAAAHRAQHREFSPAEFASPPSRPLSEDVGRHPPPPHSLIPLPPLLSGLAVSLVFASLLAWYFAKPIRSLSQAFESVSQGDLSVRLGAAMGGRRDELADLGRDFDGMAQRLQSLLDGQRRLFHDVSHELRSPLARMQAAVGIARQQPERTEQALARVERESVRMDQLVSELLTLARLESGIAASTQEEIALGEFVGNIVEDSRVEAEAKSCRLRFDETGEFCVAGNPELLRRGVENVLRNAIRHSPVDGDVTVSIQDDDAGRVQISIIDQGSGVPEDLLQQIFQPFFRGADARATDGYGLGLAIAQRVVEMHDGRILARNVSGGGFTVSIDLPLLRSGEPRLRE